MIICKRCYEEKDETEFNNSSKNTTGKHSYCRSCQSNHYKANKKKHIQNVTKRNKQQTAVIREIIWNYLLEHPCVDCGESDPIVLQFDHREPSLKFQMVPNMVTYAVSAVLEEISKCDIRCANCHIKKHATSRNVWKWQRVQHLDKNQ